MTFRSLIKKSIELIDENEKLSYSVAKELALIELNLIWGKDSIQSSSNRLKSLSEHIIVSFNKSDKAKEMAKDVKELASTLKEKY